MIASFRDEHSISRDVLLAAYGLVSIRGDDQNVAQILCQDRMRAGHRHKASPQMTMRMPTGSRARELSTMPCRSQIGGKFEKRSVSAHAPSSGRKPFGRVGHTAYHTGKQPWQYSGRSLQSSEVRPARQKRKWRTQAPEKWPQPQHVQPQAQPQHVQPQAHEYLSRSMFMPSASMTLVFI